MDNEIKNEFKDFIATLSTEICKEVLLSELEKVNTSLNNTSTKYTKLYDDYKFSIDQIEKELSRLDNLNKTVNNFTNSIDKNSKSVNEALTIIKIGQEKSLEKYKTNIQNLNDAERKKFIKLLNTNLNEYSKKYINELADIVNINKISQTLSNTQEINNSVKSANTQISLINCNIDKLAKDIMSKNEEESEIVHNKLLNAVSRLEKEIPFIKNNIKDGQKKLENKIIELEEEIKLKNKVIIGINIAMILLLFIK